MAAHRTFALPSLRYPFGTQPQGRWGISLTLKVDESGQVICYQMKDARGKNQPLNDQRRSLLAQLQGWRYKPFKQGNKKVKALFSELINEEEAPEKHLPLPEAPLDTLRIRLERGACFEDCPVYSVELSGDGHVVYRGVDFVDVVGEHRYQVPRDAVAGLLQKLRSGDLWSMRPRYVGQARGVPSIMLTIALGHDEHRIEDAGGAIVGMPVAVTDFEEAVDRVAHTDMWVSFSEAALGYLKAEHFRFHSPEGRALLARAIAGSADEKAIVELISLGAPVHGTVGPDERLPSLENVSFLDEALLNGLPAVTDALLARGVLRSDRVNQENLDAAFQAAIVGGRLALVQKIWARGGDRLHPDLTFRDPPGFFLSRHYPVTLLLTPRQGADYPWEGLQIAKWLETKGCDLQARSREGISLLDVAVRANDADFVRYLVSRGLRDPGPKEPGPTAVQGAQSEDIALLLLKSGASVPRTRQASEQFQAYAVSRHWSRVVSWLKAHTL